MIELLIVLAIAVVATVMAAMNIKSTMDETHAADGYQSSLMALRTAREAAVNQRRVYLVTFTAPRTITTTRVSTNTVISTVTLRTDVAFDAETGLPNTATTTPDGFGTGPATGALYFDANYSTGDHTKVYFYPDGSARDVNGNINNGVMYIARSGQLMSSRAISLYGLTGRLRGWRLNKKASAGTYYWRQQ